MGASSRKSTDGSIDKKSSSNQSVKSKSLRQVATRGPNTLSRVDEHSISEDMTSGIERREFNYLLLLPRLFLSTVFDAFTSKEREATVKLSTSETVNAVGEDDH